MAVVDVTQMWSRDGASVIGKKDDLQYRAATRTTAYQTLVDDPATTLDAVEAAVPVIIGDLYPGSSVIRAVRKVTARVSPIFYQTDVEYEGDNTLTLNRPIIRKSSVTSSEPIDRDWNGRAIVNVNNEAVEGLSRDVSDTLITITRNFLSVNDDLVLDYLEASNSDTWYGYSPGRARLINYQAEQIFKNENDTTGYWKVTAAIQCRRGYGTTTPDKAWYRRYRNEGLYEKIVVTGVNEYGAPTTRNFIVRAVDNAGAPVTKPVLLKANGTRETDPDNAHFLFAQVYGSLPYNSLGLL
jgi:hypothetical protein